MLRNCFFKYFTTRRLCNLRRLHFTSVSFIQTSAASFSTALNSAKCSTDMLKNAPDLGRKAVDLIAQKNQLKPVIGLEVHAQINSNSKLFSNASAGLAKLPNANVSLLDCSLPGTLPSINKRCVEHAIRTGLALHCHISPECSFDRKHYFYADLPQGYQITQNFSPIAKDGWIEFIVYDMLNPAYMKKVPVKQIQLEQDSGKSLADEDAGITLVDLNRAGIGLMEFVFEPILDTAQEAVCLAKELHLLLQRINVCTGKMEDGALRIDANVSVHRPGEPLGVRTELKNLNSFKSLVRGIETEIERQKNLIVSGQRVINETRAFDPKTKKTFAMRDKEVVQDYRFMPEPNLIPLRIRTDTSVADDSAFLLDNCKPSQTLLPETDRNYLLNECKISMEHSFRMLMFPGAFELFKVIYEQNRNRNPRLVSSFILTEMYTFLKEKKCKYTELPVEIDFVCQCLDLLQSDQITEGVAFDLLELSSSGDGRNALEIVRENKWTKVIEEELVHELVRKAIELEPYYSSVYAKKAKGFALNQILLRLDVVGRKTVSRAVAQPLIDQFLRKSHKKSEKEEVN